MCRSDVLGMGECRLHFVQLSLIVERHRRDVGAGGIADVRSLLAGVGINYTISGHVKVKDTLYFRLQVQGQATRQQVCNQNALCKY